MVAPSNGFNRIGESEYRSYGPGLGRQSHPAKASAECGNLQITCATTTICCAITTRHRSTPRKSEAANSNCSRWKSILKLSVDDFMTHARTVSSPDELSVYIAKRLMQQESPSLLWITMHDIDIAHSGAYSLYIDAIRRTDRLCAELWKAVQAEPEYAGNTTLFILPDFGRDSDEDAGGNGFQHHRTGDAPPAPHG